MTPAYITPPKECRSYRFSVPRTLILGLMFSALAAACLYLHHTAFREFLSYLTADEKKTTAWIVEQVSFALPFLIIAIMQCAVYAKHDRHDGILQKEKAYELLIVAILTYAVLLPLVWHYSDTELTLSLAAGATVEKNEGKEYQTLILSVMEWFVRFSIPLCLLFVYHMARAKAEVTETAENAALEAQKAAMENQAAETAMEATDEAAAEASAEVVSNPEEEVISEKATQGEES